MKFNMQKWAEDIMAAKDRRNLPVLYFPVLKNIGMSVPDSVSEPKKIAEAMKEVIDEYKEKTKKLLEEMEAYPHFVLSSGCDLAPSVESENIQAYYEACREYNQTNGVETVINNEAFMVK